MASPSPEGDATSMFMARRDKSGSPTQSDEITKRKSKEQLSPEIITVKDFFDFMKTAYQVYEHLEGDEDEGGKINWEELTKLTVINHVIEQQERDLLYQTAFAEPKATTSKSDHVLEKKRSENKSMEKRMSCSEVEQGGLRRRSISEVRVEMLGVWTEANLNCKLNDVINEGILDSILPYLVGYKKPTKTTSVYAPVIKKPISSTGADVKKPASFGNFLTEKESRDRLGRRKSSIIAAQEKINQKQEGDVEIHVCDEVKGLKKDFRCAQKLLVSKMGYFADVTAGQRLEDMDISVHCDIQIFDWLMRWVKRDSILVADWPLLDPHNVVPILVSASFLQMEPLLHDCLIYCHAHMNDIVKTSTNLACLSDALLNRLAAMYTNAELEAIRDRKDKIQSRLYCKMILSLAEPVPETLRGHYATLATLFKCSKCNKLLGRQIAEQVPCQPANMRIDRRGNVISSHTKDPSWSLNEYITWLYGELRTWRRVYWRLWADCHFLRCQLCDSYFPNYQMEWCSHHEQGPHMFAVENRPALPAGRYPCCGERAYRFETLTRNTGCQFREHVPDERLPTDAAVMEIYSKFREMIAMRPPQLMFPERLTRLVPRESTEDCGGRLQCKEVFWWEGIQLVPPRPPFGILGKLYTSDTKFNRSNPWAPQAVFCNEMVLVLSDLSTEGYSIRNKLETFDLPHELVALASLARFHAAIANHDTRQSRALRRPYSLMEDYGKVIIESIFQDTAWVRAGAKLTANIIQHWSKYRDSIPDLETNVLRQFLAGFDDLVERKDTLNVVLHRDLWVNNIMFKYTNGAPANAMLIDFQCVRYGPPAFDVMMLMYLTTTRSFRQQHKDAALRQYFKIFLESLETDTQLRLNILRYDYEEFLRWIEVANRFGIVAGLLIFPSTLMDPMTAAAVFGNPATLVALMNMDRTAPVFALAARCPEYGRRQLELTEEFVEMYLHKSI